MLGLAFILTGDAGYIIDVDRKKQVKLIGNDRIQSIELTPDKNSFIFADFDTVYRIDKDLNITFIDSNYDMDFIKFKGFDKQELIIEYEEPGEWKTKTCHLDINEWIIK